MYALTRRDLIKLAGAASLASMIPPVFANSGGKVVIVGGGFGGATCANFLKQYAPSLDVTLIEPKATYVTCPFSNWVIGGVKEMKDITHGYEVLQSKRQVNVITDYANSIDPAGKKLVLKGGKTLSYDHLVLAPGIDFRWDQIAGYDAKVSEQIPHAWQAGSQTELLIKQLHAMNDGGTVIIAPPAKPFRAPPAPYERASMIAYYLTKNKPKSKILILDANDNFAKQELFESAWEKLYPGMIEWVKNSPVTELDAGGMSVKTGDGQTHKGAVLNIIPPQKAGAIAADFADASGWCPIDPHNFESAKAKGIHIIGDSSIAGELPKTGHAASAEAKACAAAIVSEITGASLPDPVFAFGIYSLIKPKYAISMAGTYRIEGGKIVAASVGESSKRGRKKTRRKEARYAEGWYKGIIADSFIR